MREPALENRVLRKTWPGFNLREKRLKLLEERLFTAAVEARRLGIDRAELGEMLRLFYEEAS